jgi:hypothetical protein
MEITIPPALYQRKPDIKETTIDFVPDLPQQDTSDQDKWHIPDFIDFLNAIKFINIKI